MQIICATILRANLSMLIEKVSLGIINATSYNIVGDIKLTGNPESFQIESQKRVLEQQSTSRIFVNVPESNSIEVVDSQKHTNIYNLAQWHQMRLIIACLFVQGSPPKLMVFDTNSGKVISILDIAKDT